MHCAVNRPIMADYVVFWGVFQKRPWWRFFRLLIYIPYSSRVIRRLYLSQKILWHYDTTKSYANANSENLAREYNQGKAKNNDLTGKDTLILTSSLIIVCSSRVIFHSTAWNQYYSIIVCSFSSISKGKGSIILQNIPSLMKHICLVRIIFRKVKVGIRVELKGPLLNLYLFHNLILWMLKLACKVLPLLTKSAT